MENISIFSKNHNGQCMPTFKTTGLKKCSTMPTTCEWERLWSSWDLVTTTIINHNFMLFEQPIDLRHPFIFYLGHIPTFLDVMITRHKVDCVVAHQEQSLTEPATFADIFERGIDPDMDDPTQCNPHSNVPDQGNWPSINAILQYQQLVRKRLIRLLLRWESEDSMNIDDHVELKHSRKRSARVVWMCFEHEAMHLETLLYMIVQSPNFRHPPVSPPSWYKRNGEHKYRNHKSIPSILLKEADMIVFDGSNVEIGHDDFEDSDFSSSIPPDTIEFGWDNEHPKRVIAVSPFELQTRPVTNGEYWLFWKTSDYDKLMFPASWKIQNSEFHDLPKVKTCFGLCEFHIAVNWPVQVSCQQAEAYAASKKNDMRLPTEPEWIHFRRTMEEKHTPEKREVTMSNKQDSRNFGFKFWTPQPLNNEEVHVVGDVWEWTSTIWDYYEGFTNSQLYPGYSADFFDGKHRVILGASWATHHRIAERLSFRNWYQWRYPYVFCGFRLSRSL